MAASFGPVNTLVGATMGRDLIDGRDGNARLGTDTRP